MLIDCKISSYDEGNRALRYFVGFGAGAANSLIKVDLFNHNKENVGSFEIKASLRMGGFGGNAKDILNKSAKVIVKYIKKHYINKEKK